MTEQQAPENCSSTAVHPRVQRAELAVLSGRAGPAYSPSPVNHSDPTQSWASVRFTDVEEGG